MQKEGWQRDPTQMLRTRSPHLLERLIIKVESVPTRCQVYEDVKQLVKQKWLRLFSSEVTIYPGEKYEPSDTSPFFQSD